MSMKNVIGNRGMKSLIKVPSKYVKNIFWRSLTGQGSPSGTYSVKKFTIMLKRNTDSNAITIGLQIGEA